MTEEDAITSGSPGSARSVWPAVIGAISVALGINALISLPFCVALLASTWARGRYLMSIPYYGLPLLFLPAGIMLIRRNRWGVVLHVAIAAATICLMVPHHILFRLQHGASLPHPIWGDLVWLAHTIAYPGFLLAWFARRAVRRQICQWPVVPVAGGSEGRSDSTWVPVIGALAIVLTAERIIVDYLQVPDPWWGDYVNMCGVMDLASRGAFLLLLAGGVMLLRRKRSARVFFLLFAVVEVALLIAGLGWGFAEQMLRQLSYVSVGEFFRQVYWQRLAEVFLPQMTCAVLAAWWFLRPAIRRQIRAWP